MKRILPMFLLLLGLVLTACGSVDDKLEVSKAEADKPETEERKGLISNDETMEYLGNLIEPYLELSNLETEEQALEVVEEIGNNSQEIKRELKSDFEKDIHAVEDLIVLADIFTELTKDVEDGNLGSVGAYGERTGKQIRVIATEYLDGDLPEDYAKVVGAANVYDLE